MFPFFIAVSGEQKSAPDNPGRSKHAVKSLIFRITAGFGTLRHSQVAGLHRAVPSTTLDKVFSCLGFRAYYISNFPDVNVFCAFLSPVLERMPDRL